MFVFKNGAQWATDDQRNDYVVAFHGKEDAQDFQENVLGADFALVEIPSRVFFSQMASNGARGFILNPYTQETEWVGDTTLLEQIQAWLSKS